MHSKSLFAGFAAVVIAAIAFGVPPAHAGNVDVVIDSTDLTLSPDGQGRYTGSVSLTNLSDATIPVQPIVATPGCSVSANPVAVPSGQHKTVKLTFGAGCPLDDPFDVTLSFGGASNPQLYVLKATKKLTGPDWSILAKSFTASVLASGAFLVWVLFWSKPRKAAGRRFPSKRPINGLGTDWSFKDTWVGNITVASTVLVALIGSSDVLSSLVGDKPEAALVLMIAAGGAASVLVGLGPLIIKGIGEDTKTPTFLGAVVASFVTLVGVVGGIFSAWLQTWVLVDHGAFRVADTALALLTLVAIGMYARLSILDWRDKALKVVVAEDSQAVQAAKIVAQAIRREEPTVRISRVTAEASPLL